MKRIFGFKRSIALLLTLCLLWVPNAALAATAKTADHTLTEEQMQLVDKAKEFTQYTDNGIVFDQKGAQKAGLPASFVKEMGAFYQRLNDQASKNGFQWGELLKSIEARTADAEATPTQSSEVTPQWSGRNAGIYYQVTLTEPETRLIIDALAVGVSAGGLYALLAGLGMAALPFAGLVGVVAALLAVGGSLMAFIDTLGGNKGVYIRLYYSGSILIWHN